jgi:hypothetical protein
LESQDPKPELELSLINHFNFHNHHVAVLRMKLDHLNEESGHVSISFGMEIFKKTLELW